MTPPDRAAVTITLFILGDAGIAAACGAPWAALILTLIAGAAAALFWHVPAAEDEAGHFARVAEIVREDPCNVIDLFEWEREMRQP